VNPYLPEAYVQYNFKKTSWKKAATFLKKYMEKEGLIKTKDRAGDIVIISINWNHKLISEFQPYEIGHKEVEKPVSREDNPSTTQIQIHELYKPSSELLRTILESISKTYFSSVHILIE
jgi:translation initiation factor 2D